MNATSSAEPRTESNGHNRPSAEGSGASGPVTCHVISHNEWIAQTMIDQLSQDSHWQLHWQDGLSPTSSIKAGDALWVDPGLLIAQNAWLKSLGHPQIKMLSPPANWLTFLDRNLLGRTVLVAKVEDIRSWSELPREVGAEPWSQVAGGRVPTFSAARRNLIQLQKDLKQAPQDSLIQISGHLEAIDQEWRVVILDGRAVASSGYCRHKGPDSRDIITIFDGAHFSESMRAPAEEAAIFAARQGGIDAVCLDIAFLASATSEAGYKSSHPLVLEANPAWCCSPYDYGHDGIEGFMAAIQAGRIPESEIAYNLETNTVQGCENKSVPLNTLHHYGQTIPRSQTLRQSNRMTPYHPDPWVVSQFHLRYRTYWGHK